MQMLGILLDPPSEIGKYPYRVRERGLSAGRICGSAFHDMAISQVNISAQAENDADVYSAVFVELTDKQHEVLKLLTENCTSKEIAAALGVTESAINQRIETIRGRAGSLPRPRLARAYQQYQSRHDAPQRLSPVADLIERKRTGSTRSRRED